MPDGTGGEMIEFAAKTCLTTCDESLSDHHRVYFRCVGAGAHCEGRTGMEWGDATILAWNGLPHAGVRSVGDLGSAIIAFAIALITGRLIGQGCRA